uniref:Uncharacterized protein n=1 Tax=Eutreptiella gymnastica TaxID=73025 RepID=A0A7S4LF23_9EUGL
MHALEFGKGWSIIPGIAVPLLPDAMCSCFLPRAQMHVHWMAEGSVVHRSMQHALQIQKWLRWTSEPQPNNPAQTLALHEPLKRRIKKSGCFQTLQHLHSFGGTEPPPMPQIGSCAPPYAPKVLVPVLGDFKGSFPAPPCQTS